MCTEMGVADASPVEPSVREELDILEQALACPEDPPCTDLLTDPVSVLSDEKRWPNHLCRGRFLYRSTTEWASSHSVALTTVLSKQWYEWKMGWPLLIGKQALAVRFGISNGEIFNLMPFEEREEALWAIRITAGDDALDLFGLGAPYEQGGERVYRMGELRYDLRGQGTALFELVARAERWWARFRGKKITGRPRDSGTWASADEFRKALKAAVRTLRSEGRKVTQENVADVLWCQDRTLRKWIERFSLRWEDVKKTS